MQGNNGTEIPVVRMFLHFADQIDAGLYNYFHPMLTVR